MSNIGNFGSLEEELAAEVAASAGGARPANGKKFWENRITQSNLPKGTSTFRILPRPGHHVPWLSWFEHSIGNKTPATTARKFVRFTCPSDGADNGTCEACSNFLPRLAGAVDSKGRPLDGAETMAKEGKAKKQFAVAVQFETWGGKAVPEDAQGPKAFIYGQGVHKGSDRATVRGILGLAKQYQGQLWDIENGLTVSITKTGEGMLTQYSVEAVQSMQDVEIGGRKQKMLMPTMSAIVDAADVMENLPELEPFARPWKASEVAAAIRDINPMEPGSAPAPSPAKVKGGADRFRNKAGGSSSVQDQIGDDTDIPF
jgi:hypothetical protein